MGICRSAAAPLCERVAVTQHFWSPDTDPAHPMDCTQSERYVLRRLGSDRYVAIDPVDQGLRDVVAADQAHAFHTHEAALRAAAELNKLGNGGVDVVKVE